MKKKSEKEIGEGLEELLYRLRKRENLTYLEIVEKLNNKTVTEKDVKMWEKGLKYPDLDLIYELSNLYQIPSIELIQAKSNSYEKGLQSVHMTFIKWMCYIFDISIQTGIWITRIFLAVALVLSFMYFLSQAESVHNYEW